MKRIESQIQNLGSSGLSLKKLELENAKTENAEPIPEHILTSLPVPNMQSIPWIALQSFQEDVTNAMDGDSKLAKHFSADGQKLLRFVQFYHVQVCAL